MFSIAGALLAINYAKVAAVSECVCEHHSIWPEGELDSVCVDELQWFFVRASECVNVSEQCPSFGGVGRVHRSSWRIGFCVPSERTDMYRTYQYLDSIIVVLALSGRFY